FSGANALDQNIFEFTDDLTVTRGNHNIVVGTHNEVFKFSNLFIADAYGYYYFPTLAALQSGTPTIYRIGFATAAIRAGRPRSKRGSTASTPAISGTWKTA